MVAFNTGDRVRIKKRPHWPHPPGYRFDDAEGTVVKWVEFDESSACFEDFVFIKLEKAEGLGVSYIGSQLLFHKSAIEII